MLFDLNLFLVSVQQNWPSSSSWGGGQTIQARLRAQHMCHPRHTPIDLCMPSWLARSHATRTGRAPKASESPVECRALQDAVTGDTGQTFARHLNQHKRMRDLGWRTWPTTTTSNADTDKKHGGEVGDACKFAQAARSGRRSSNGGPSCATAGATQTTPATCKTTTWLRAQSLAAPAAQLACAPPPTSAYATHSFKGLSRMPPGSSTPRQAGVGFCPYTSI